MNTTVFQVSSDALTDFKAVCEGVYDQSEEDLQDLDFLDIYPILPHRYCSDTESWRHEQFNDVEFTEITLAGWMHILTAIHSLSELQEEETGWFVEKYFFASFTPRMLCFMDGDVPRIRPSYLASPQPKKYVDPGGQNGISSLLYALGIKLKSLSSKKPKKYSSLNKIIESLISPNPSERPNLTQLISEFQIQAVKQSLIGYPNGTGFWTQMTGNNFQIWNSIKFSKFWNALMSWNPNAIHYYNETDRTILKSQFERFFEDTLDPKFVARPAMTLTTFSDWLFWFGDLEPQAWCVQRYLFLGYQSDCSIFSELPFELIGEIGFKLEEESFISRAQFFFKQDWFFGACDVSKTVSMLRHFGGDSGVWILRCGYNKERQRPWIISAREKAPSQLVVHYHLQRVGDGSYSMHLREGRGLISDSLLGILKEFEDASGMKSNHVIISPYKELETDENEHQEQKDED